MNLPDKPELREAVINDAGAIASLIRQSFSEQVDMLELGRSECPEYVGFETAERVRRRMQEGNHILVADLAGRLIGTVAFGGIASDLSKGEIARLAVLPKYRGTGFGRILMGAAEAALGQVGVEVVEISIVAKFHRLQSYYEALGYKTTRRQRFDALPFDVLFMQKRIQSKRC